MTHAPAPVETARQAEINRNRAAWRRLCGLLALLGAVWLGLWITGLVTALRADAEPARPICGSRAVIVGAIEKYGAQRLGGGQTADGRVVEVFVSMIGEFTVLTTIATGHSCTAYIGAGWVDENTIMEVANGGKAQD